MPATFSTFEIVVGTALEDDATCALWECGTVGIQVEALDADRVAMVASFPEGPGVEARLREAFAGLPEAVIRPVVVPDVDWVARFREDFRRFDAAGFTIVPEWDAPDGGGDPDTLVIDPGRAFGTGTHETTRLCLAFLSEEARERPLARVLDVGAGTGVLAVAALKRGAQHAVAVDNDEEATASCRVHGRLNGVPLRVVLGDGGRAFRPRAFDLVLANLMAPLLVERSAELTALGRPGAALVLSGLLVDDVAAVAAAFAHGGAVETRTLGEWAALRVRLP
jgi:ribosomal protein L11 methyltransferase